MTVSFTSYTQRLTGWGTAVCMITMLAIIGCGTQSNPMNSNVAGPGFGAIPLAIDPTDNSPDPFLEEDADVDPADIEFINLTDLATRRVRKARLISAEEGGTIVVRNKDFRYKMKFPPGALSQDTKIWIELSNEGLAVLDMKFEPHGTQFLKPVTLVMRVRLPRDVDISVDDVDIFYNDEEDEGSDHDGEWEPQNAEVQIRGRWLRARAEIHHFSQYGLGGYGLIQKWEYQNGIVH